MKLKSILFAVAVALVVVAGYSIAQQVRDGSTSPSNGLSYWPMGGSDGTSNRVVKLDPSGILRVTEEYPVPYQTDRTTLCVNDSVYAGLKYMGSWYCGPFAQRTLFVQRTVRATATAVDKVYLYLYGSDDNLSYYPILLSTAWSDRTNAGADDTLLVDSLRISLPSTFSAGKFTFPSDVYPGRYMAIYARRDSSNAVSRQVLTIAAEGRMF